MNSQTLPAHRLRASQDIASGSCVFPPVPETSPSADRYRTIDLSPIGELYTFTVLHSHPKSGKPPSIVGYVDFPEEARVFATLVLPEGHTPRIGMLMRPGVRDGEAESFVFVPVEPAQA
jgi:uncharacterized OB-fold protein